MDLKAYLVLLRKWWWILIITTVSAGALAFFILQRQAPLYQARATLVVGRAIDDPNPSSGELSLTQQLVATYMDLAMRDPVIDATKAALGLPELPGYKLDQVRNTQIVEIVVTDLEAQRAQAVANELANQLIQQSPGNLVDRELGTRQDFINQQLNDLEAGITATQNELAQKQQDMASMLSGTQIGDAQVAIAGLQSKLNILQSNYAALLANTGRGAINSISLVAPAKLPEEPIDRGTRNKTILAALLGFFLGAGIAYLLEYLDDSLKNPDNVREQLGLTTLGAVPRLEKEIGEDGGELVVMSGQNQAAAEAYRVLRTNLQFAAVSRPLRTLMVSSPTPGEGKSFTAANLGAAVAQGGRRAIVVDCDLHRPRQHRVFKLPNAVGVTTALLADQPDLEDLLHETAVPGLRVLTSGPLPPNPSELLGTTRMQELLVALTQYADMVIVDTPPVTALSDAAILSAQIDGVMLVVDARRTSCDVARRALDALDQVQARVVGIVLNRMPTRGGGTYYYYYHYGHYYGAENGHHNGSDGHLSRGGLQGAFRKWRSGSDTAVAEASRGERTNGHSMPQD